MLRRFSFRRIVGFFLLDWLGTLGLLLLADFLRLKMGSLPGPLDSLLRGLQIQTGSVEVLTPTLGANLPFPVFLLVAAIWPFFLTTFSVYDGRRNETIRIEQLNVFQAINVSLLVLAGSLFFTYRETSRLTLLIFAILDNALLLGSRWFLWAYRRRQSSGPRYRRRAVLVVGAGTAGCLVAEQLRQYAWANIDLRGFLDDDPQQIGRKCVGIPVLGSFDQVRDVALAHSIQDAVVALPLAAHERLVNICRELQQCGVHVHVVPDLFALSFPNATLDGFGGIPVIDLGMPGIQGIRRLSKRVFDLLAATLGLILAAPLMAIIALLIKLESRGPVIYRQVRIGENGRPFTMFKFRSMRVGSDTGAHQSYVARLIQQNLSLDQVAHETGQKSLKMENDPRITRIGRLIRKTSLDELPQFFNVLRGEMSLVGPRPPLPYEAELYKEWHRRRFEAPPGMTGLWQVEGRNRVSFDEMVRMDLEYIERQSVWLDLRLLLQTPLALILARGAG
jgi:exopolysaccharide biosynthesis polyprenyl glycosylphosphotransferase